MEYNTHNPPRGKLVTSASVIPDSPPIKITRGRQARLNEQGPWKEDAD